MSGTGLKFEAPFPGSEHQNVKAAAYGTNVSGFGEERSQSLHINARPRNSTK